MVGREGEVASRSSFALSFIELKEQPKGRVNYCTSKKGKKKKGQNQKRKKYYISRRGGERGEISVQEGE